MRLRIVDYGLWIGLLSILACSAGAVEGPIQDKLKLENPFFPFCVEVPEATLNELGYAPIQAIWPAINVDKTPAYDNKVIATIQRLKGTDTVLWIMVKGRRQGASGDKDEKAVKALRELADIAKGVGVRFSIYPHTGFYLATTGEALRIVKKVDRPNVGLTLNLCHELMTDGMDGLAETVKAAAPHLFVVTINGADRKERGKKASWKQLIQPLGQGSYDVYGFLKTVTAAGFNGPIGLQCYGLPGALGGKKGDPLPHLTQSMQAWKDYAKRMSAE